MSYGGYAELGEDPFGGVIGMLVFAMAEAEADGGIAVPLFGPGADHAAGAGFNYGDAVQLAFLVEHLRHADLLAYHNF